jgi:hypothetical protein
MNETNLLNLVRPWLDTNYQMITKFATVSFCINRSVAKPYVQCSAGARARQAGHQNLATLNHRPFAVAGCGCAIHEANHTARSDARANHNQRQASASGHRASASARRASPRPRGGRTHGHGVDVIILCRGFLALSSQTRFASRTTFLDLVWKKNIVLVKKTRWKLRIIRQANMA